MSTKTTKATSKKTQTRGIPAVKISAYSIETKKLVKKFPSIAAAGRWAAENGYAADARTAAANICSASLGRESRDPSVNRTKAYDCTWKRA